MDRTHAQQEKNAMAAAAETKDVDSAASAKEIPQTSIAARGSKPGEVTVQFRKWTAHGLTAYQRGQFAGLAIGIAEELEKAGRVVIDPAYRRTTTERMVRK
jgi:hypothetical protein